MAAHELVTTLLPIDLVKYQEQEQDNQLPFVVSLTLIRSLQVGTALLGTQC